MHLLKTISMLKYMFALFITTTMLVAQTAHEGYPKDIQVGTLIKIGKPKSAEYKDINFPRPNVILKRGGVIDFDRLQDQIVVVTSLKTTKNGITKIRIEREDKNRFFMSHTSVSANLTRALVSGELMVLK